jgi:hypothetical protein
MLWRVQRKLLQLWPPWQCWPVPFLLSAGWGWRYSVTDGAGLFRFPRTLRHPYSGTAAILRDELDACFLEAWGAKPTYSVSSVSGFNTSKVIVSVPKT